MACQTRPEGQAAETVVLDHYLVGTPMNGTSVVREEAMM